MPYLGVLELCSRQGAIQIQVYLTFTLPHSILSLSVSNCCLLHCYRHLTENPVLLKTSSDVAKFIDKCPPQEINASTCVLGLYQTSDKAGQNCFYMCFAVVGAAAAAVTKDIRLHLKVQLDRLKNCSLIHCA